MSFLDRLRVSIRHIRGRMVESILVVLATAVGVALVAAMAAFIRDYNQQTDYLLSHPAYRELLVEAVGDETELDEPAVEFDPAVTSEVSLGYDDVQTALDNTTLVTYGYVANQTELSTQFGGAGFGGRAAAFAGRAGGQGFAGGNPGGAPPSGDAPAPEGEFVVIEGVADGESAPPSGGEGETSPVGAFRQRGESSAAEGGERPQFDIEQFFEVEEGVLTELPLDTFPGREVSASYFPAYGLAVAQGSEITDEDLVSGNQVIVLGEDLAGTLFPDGEAIGTRVRLNLQTYTVIGILFPTELTDTDTGASYNDMAFVPNTAAQINFGGNTVRVRRPIRTLRFAVGDSANLELAAAELESHFDAEFGEGAVRITAPLEELKSEREKLGRILSVVLFLAAAGLFIASINLFNLMLMRVIKRTKGIGISRALGSTRREVARQFLNESAFMSLAGAVIGLAVSPVVYGLLRSALVANAAETSLVSWPFLVVGAAAAFVFSLMFGVYPARQAGRIDSAIAIRSE